MLQNFMLLNYKNFKRLLHNFHIIIIPFLITTNAFAKTTLIDSTMGFAVIKGHVENSKVDFWTLNQKEYLGSTTLGVPIDKEGNFLMQIKVKGRVQDLILNLGDTITPVYIFIEKNDTITLSWDANNVEKTFTARNTNFMSEHDLKTSLLLNNLYFKKNIDFRVFLSQHIISDSLKFFMVNDLYNQEIETLLSEGVYPHTTKMAADIYFKYVKLLSSIKLLPIYDLFIQHPSKSSLTILMLTKPKFYRIESEELYKSSSNYRDFIFNAIRFNGFMDYSMSFGYEKEQPSEAIPFAPGWQDYYAGLSNFYLYEMRDWYCTMSIINDFNEYAFDDACAVYKDFMTKVKIPYYADTLKAFYKNIQRLKPGTPAPAFTLKNEAGKLVSLSDFKGKVVYIDFWGIHCSPCLYDIEHAIPLLHEKYKDKNIVFLNICVDANVKDWKEHLLKLNFKGTNLIAEGWQENRACQAYGVTGIPHYYLINADGKMIDNNSLRPSQPTLIYEAFNKLLK